MRKSKKLKELESAVIRMEMQVDLLTLSLSNLLESQGLAPIPTVNTLERGKWYTPHNINP
jgi:hypothetical protein